MKYCKRCDTWKEESEYYPSSDTKGSLRSPCKSCCSLESKNNRAKNGDAIKAKQKEWYRDNLDWVIGKVKKYQKENKDKVSMWGEKHRRMNVEKEKIRHKKYDDAHPDQLRMRWSNHRAKKNAGGKVYANEWRDLLQKYGNKCLKCGRSDVTIEMDHVIPIAKGGLNVIENIQPLCRSCNAKKHTKIIDYRSSAI